MNPLRHSVCVVLTCVTRAIFEGGREACLTSDSSWRATFEILTAGPGSIKWFVFEVT